MRQLVLLLLIVVAGCAFDVSFVKMVPAEFHADRSCTESWALLRGESVALGTGFPTELKKGTRWRCIGSVEAGNVFATTDQIVTVEASNIYEALAVVSNRQLVGFYLPVEKMMVPVSPAVALQIEGSGA